MSEPVTYEVAKLDGALLDQAVAYADRRTNRMHLVPAPIFCEAFYPLAEGWRRYAPSTDGNQGIEIIDRWLIELIPQAVLLSGHEDAKWCALAGSRPGGPDRVMADGPTALVAAMRAVVLFVVGAKITLPGILP